MATYAPNTVGVQAPAGGFQQGGWYGGRQYWGGTLSDPGVIHEQSTQQGAGQLVSKEVNAQSAAAQGQTPQQLEAYLQAQRAKNPRTPTTMAPQSQAVSMGASGVSGAGGMGGVMQTQAQLNLPDLYNNLYSSSGINEAQAALSEKEKQFTEAKGKINDNPFLSEATRVGRVAKLEQLYNERTANDRNDIAQRKADIETQMQLQTKQFDINSQATQQAMQQFNTLLSMGALSGASGEDIANITRSTGVSSGMIQSAIDASNKKDVKSQVIKSEADDGTVTLTVVNADTGEIINQQSLGRIGNVQKSTTATTEQKLSPSQQKAAVEMSLYNYVRNKNSQSQISPEDLYRTLMSTYPEAYDIASKYTPDIIRNDIQEYDKGL